MKQPDYPRYLICPACIGENDDQPPRQSGRVARMRPMGHLKPRLFECGRCGHTVREDEYVAPFDNHARTFVAGSTVGRRWGGKTLGEQYR